MGALQTQERNKPVLKPQLSSFPSLNCHCEDSTPLWKKTPHIQKFLLLRYYKPAESKRSNIVLNEAQFDYYVTAKIKHIDPASCWMRR